MFILQKAQMSWGKKISNKERSMKITEKTTKILAAVAALLLFSAAQAQAGAVTLTGAIDWITEDTPRPVVSYDSPVTLQLTWDDRGVSALGKSTVYFGSVWGNTMTFTVGDLTLKDTPAFGEVPIAYFTDGIFDGFKLNMWNASVIGAPGNGWSFFAEGFAPDNPNIFLEIMDYSSPTADWFTGYLDFPATTTSSAVPVPGAVWLFGSGLIGLAGLRRKMK